MLFSTGSLLSLIAISPVALALPGASWYKRQEDAQTSLTLDPAVLAVGHASDGQDPPVAGQVPSLTSANNFINFCLTQNAPITNGQQKTEGSCNPTPMGRIIGLDQSPRAKFVFPPNGDKTLAPNQPFTIQLKLQFMQTGNFVNPNTNYYAAPQTVNGQGIVIGHSHVVIEPLPAIDSTEPLDPFKFVFFKGLNAVAQGDILTTEVTAGVAAGAYRLCSINTAANHQPVIVSNAQHGSLDDCIYFEVGADPNANATADAAEETSTEAEASSTSDVADAAATDAAATDVAETTEGETSADSSTEEGSTDAAPTEGGAPAPEPTTEAGTDDAAANNTEGDASTDEAAAADNDGASTEEAAATDAQAPPPADGQA